MPNIHVELTDTFDMWRQKTNDMLDVVYSLTGAGVISISSLQNGQILISNTGMFRNVTVYGDVTFDTDGHAHIHNNSGPSQGRMRFAGSLRYIY